MFSEDLRLWKKHEREFAGLLFKNFPVVKLETAEWDFKDWDVKATFNLKGEHVEKTYEVKLDTISPTTWEVCIEHSYNWHPSWVYSSKADVIVYSLWDEFFLVGRPELLHWLTTAQKTEKVWGDGNKSWLYIVNKEDFRTISKVIWKD